MSLVTRQAPDFSAQAVVKDQITNVHLGQFRGQYVILFFYPLDFTFVCPGFGLRAPMFRFLRWKTWNS